jgi:pre-mRNA-splicing factor SPF27
MKKEFERLETRQPMEMLSMKRYELQPPAVGKLTEVSAWNECVENSYAQLEHQACRILNLETMAEYGSTAWRLYNQTLQTMFDEAQKQLLKLRKEIQDINLQRKTEQTYAGDKLRVLEQT